jgi:hypothetical protein
MPGRMAAVVTLCLAFIVPVNAQWVNHPSPGIPRTKDGKPNLSAGVPTTADGKPDLSGVWTTDRTPLEELERLFPGMSDLSVPGDGPEVVNKYFINLLADFKPVDSPLRKEFVIESRGFNDKTWLDAFGHPRSEAIRITERLRRRDFGHMEVQVTIEDATMYTRPFSVRYSVTLTPDTDLLETVCENERDVPHLVGK